MQRLTRFCKRWGLAKRVALRAIPTPRGVYSQKSCSPWAGARILKGIVLRGWAEHAARGVGGFSGNNLRIMRFFFILAICAGCLPLGPAARGDVFVLKGGGRLEGVRRNTEAPREADLEVALQSGGTSALAPERVEEVVSLSDTQRRYKQMAPLVPNTVEGQMKMAEWCVSVGLRDAREAHLKRVIELEPNHEAARYALGYTKHDGRWVLTDEWMQQQGYVRYKGTWWLRQHVEIDIRASERNDRIGKWRGDINMWWGWLGGRRHATAIENLTAVKDPLAAKPVAEKLEKEKSYEGRRLLLEMLGRIPGSTSVSALVKVALEEEDVRLRDLAVAQLDQQSRHRAAVSGLLKGLDHEDTRIVNRAAAALARFEEDAITLPLIDALTTKHKFLIKSGNPNSIGASFGSGPGGPSGGLSAGGRPKIFEQELQNENVLSALIARTEGANYRFDKDAWKAWYTAQRTPTQLDLRRDP